MIEDFDSVPNTIQKAENILFIETSISLFEKPIVSSQTISPPSEGISIATAPKAPEIPLKLITSAAVSGPVYKSEPSPRHYFIAEIRKRSPYDFTMVAHDPFHYLRCESPLKFEKNEGYLSLICRFPTICDDALVDFIEEDEDLLGIILISFHMHILQNLFLFCGTYNIQNLIIKATEEQFKGLGIYHEFIKHVDKVPTKKGMAMEITIPVYSYSRAKCDKLMDDMTAQFRKTLWQEQRANSAIREYLKANVRLSVVH